MKINNTTTQNLTAAELLNIGGGDNCYPPNNDPLKKKTLQEQIEELLVIKPIIYY